MRTSGKDLGGVNQKSTSEFRVNFSKVLVQSMSFSQRSLQPVNIAKSGMITTFFHFYLTSIQLESYLLPEAFDVPLP